MCVRRYHALLYGQDREEQHDTSFLDLEGTLFDSPRNAEMFFKDVGAVASLLRGHVTVRMCPHMPVHARVSTSACMQVDVWACVPTLTVRATCTTLPVDPLCTDICSPQDACNVKYRRENYCFDVDHPYYEVCAAVSMWVVTRNRRWITSTYSFHLIHIHTSCMHTRLCFVFL